MTNDIQNDIDRVKAIIADLHPSEDTPYNDRQIKILAQGYMFNTFIEAGFERDDYFHWLADPAVGTLDQKLSTVFSAKIQQIHSEHIQKHGWSLIGVGAGDNDPAFCYTIGLTAKVGFELIGVNIPISIANAMMNEVCQGVVDGSIPLDTVFEINGFGIGESNVRAKIVDIALDSPTASNVKSRVPGITVTQIKQLWCGDANNILPDEEGYDSSYIQTLSSAD